MILDIFLSSGLVNDNNLFVCVLVEKVIFFGKDWYRFCLRCEKCNKILSFGGYVEVRVFFFKFVEELFFEIFL